MIRLLVCAARWLSGGRHDSQSTEHTLESTLLRIRKVPTRAAMSTLLNYFRWSRFGVWMNRSASWWYSQRFYWSDGLDTALHQNIIVFTLCYFIFKQHHFFHCVQQSPITELTTWFRLKKWYMFRNLLPLILYAIQIFACWTWFNTRDMIQHKELCIA